MAARGKRDGRRAAMGRWRLTFHDLWVVAIVGVAAAASLLLFAGPPDVDFARDAADRACASPGGDGAACVKPPH